MAEVIKLEEVVVDRDAEILALATEYHDNLCGCSSDDLAPYVERITELYDEGEFG
jgi:hypothetical protein